MIKIIALSDTHLDSDLPKNLAELVQDADLIMHAGDFTSVEIYNLLNHNLLDASYKKSEE